jgi:hypothetical protein
MQSYYVHTWPYTFPELIPVSSSPSSSTPTSSPSSFQPIHLSPGLLYMNTMESVASAMEESTLSGANAARIIEDLLK